MRRTAISESLTNPPILVGTKVKLRPKLLKDAANDYSWRTDTELCQLDATAPTVRSFEEYLSAYAEELRYPGLDCRFAIETLEGRHIGNCSFFNIDKLKNEAELGIMIGDKAYWNQAYGVDAILTILKHIFSQTNLEKIYLKTLNWNIRAQKCFEKCGFVPRRQFIYGNYSFIIMEIHRSDKPQQQAK